MAQNMYDNEAFFKEYIQLPRQVKGLDGTPEWPDLQSMFPRRLEGKNVADLGCGFGWVSRYCIEQGAAKVLAVDISGKMLSKARTFPSNGITYVQGDLESFNLDFDAYDFIFSSLTLHYISNLARLLSEIKFALKPGGSFVFSIEHPIFSAPRNAKFIKDSEGHSVWPLDGYFDEGKRTTNWLAEGVVKEHHTVSSWITKLLSARFTLWQIKEWCPSEQQVKENPMWADEQQRPSFLLIRVVKDVPTLEQF
jgi:SAM-dependent methyltransferase